MGIWAFYPVPTSVTVDTNALRKPQHFIPWARYTQVTKYSILRITFHILILIVLLFITSCEEEIDQRVFCSSCDVKTESVELIEENTGRLWYDKDLQKYGIIFWLDADKYCYVPCELPDNFTPQNDLVVNFSGRIIEDQVIIRKEPRLFYKCIDLDTLYLPSGITILLDKTYHSEFEFFKMYIQNNLKDTILTYRPCTYRWYLPISYIEKFENDNWVRQFPPPCFFDGPEYIIGITLPGEVTKDSTDHKYLGSGLYRTSTTIFLNNDTISIYSNEFLNE